MIVVSVLLWISIGFNARFIWDRWIESGPFSLWEIFAVILLGPLPIVPAGVELISHVARRKKIQRHKAAYRQKQMMKALRDVTELKERLTAEYDGTIEMYEQRKGK